MITNKVIGSSSHSSHLNKIKKILIDFEKIEGQNFTIILLKNELYDIWKILMTKWFKNIQSAFF